MTKLLRLFADGARNEETKEVGWAYLLVHGDTVLSADCGATSGSATDGEYLAVIHGLLAIPYPVSVQVVTDREDIGEAMSDPHFGGRTKKRLLAVRRNLIWQLADYSEITCSVIKSGGHHFHRQADTLSRYACGLRSKNYLKGQSKKRAKRVKKRLQESLANQG